MLDELEGSWNWKNKHKETDDKNLMYKMEWIC